MASEVLGGCFYDSIADCRRIVGLCLFVNAPSDYGALRINAVQLEWIGLERVAVVCGGNEACHPHDLSRMRCSAKCSRRAKACAPLRVASHAREAERSIS